MARGTIRVFGAGGAGTNIVSRYMNAASEEISAQLMPVVIDTSRSNLDKTIPEENMFILPDLDGSGKVRKENYEKIKDVIKRVLHLHRPGDFNVIVFSASGGSGSVIGPLLMSELLATGKTAVCVVIGSDESVITAQNTLNTLKSLEGVAKTQNKPVVMHYRHNTRGKPRGEVDQEIHFAISMLSVLASRTIKGLDTMDIANWVNYPKTTSVGPRLAAMEIFIGGQEAWKDYTPISVLSIYKDVNQPTLPIVPEYHCDGFADIQGLPAIHYFIDVSVIQKFAARIAATLKELDDERNSRLSLGSLITSSDVQKDDGMIL